MDTITHSVMRVCVECGDDFLDSVRDQEYRRDMGFKDPPKRCRACRDARRRPRGGLTRTYQPR